MMEHYYLLSTKKNSCLNEMLEEGMFRHLRRNQPGSGDFLDLALAPDASKKLRIYFAFFDRVREGDSYKTIRGTYLLDGIEQEPDAGSIDTPKYALRLKRDKYFSQPLPFGEKTELWEKLSKTKGKKTTSYYNGARILLDISPDDFEAILQTANNVESAGSKATESSSASRGVPVDYEEVLRDFLSDNLTDLEEGLQPWDEEEYVEVDTGSVGRIDLFAKDSKGRPVVIELKRSMGDDEVIGQLCRYMGWVKEEKAKDKEVRGIIVANVLTDRLRFAAKAVPGVKLVTYDVKFTFKMGYASATAQ